MFLGHFGLAMAAKKIPPHMINKHRPPAKA